MNNFNGIDTSAHNGLITESVLKQVDFVIIRAGYGSDIASQDDTQFANTVALCERFNKPWGAYLYSYALNVEMAESEAKHITRVLNGKVPPMGVWIDMEDADSYKKKHGMPDNKTLCEICKRFCDLTGGGIYASLYWFNTYLNDSSLDCYDKWVAQWANGCTYKKPYKMWQYTSDLKIDGKRFDGNKFYGNINSKTIEDVAQEVLQGKWGNGEERKVRLTNAGYDYKSVQNIVNALVGNRKTIDEIAREVIQGKWGNGQERKQKLENAGYSYKQVQSRVNELM